MTDFVKSYLSAAEAVLPEFADAALAEKLEAMTRCLAERGKQMNLTAITEGDSVLWLHVIDSLYAARAIKAAGVSTLIDVGSGAGFPALPVAAALPDVTVTALDSTAKKCAYIEECAGVMGLENVKTVSVRAEEYGLGEGREKYDAASARAVAALPVLMELCVPLVREGGFFFPMKGASASEEEEAARRAAGTLGVKLAAREDYPLAGHADAHTVFTYRKEKHTPANFPRKYARIVKAPL